MNYTICISPNCASCTDILNTLNEMKIKLEVKDINSDIDCSISIIPALFKGKRLIAYGKDIINYFRKKKIENNAKLLEKI